MRTQARSFRSRAPLRRYEEHARAMTAPATSRRRFRRWASSRRARISSISLSTSAAHNLNAKVRGPGESKDNPDHLCRCCRNKGRMVRHMAF